MIRQRESSESTSEVLHYSKQKQKELVTGGTKPPVTGDATLVSENLREKVEK